MDLLEKITIKRLIIVKKIKQNDSKKSTVINEKQNKKQTIITTMRIPFKYIHYNEEKIF